MNFPPTTTHELEADLLLNMLATVTEPRSAVYVSTPITSGRRFAEWSSQLDAELDLSHPETYEAFQREVLVPNSQHARRRISDLRRRFNILIDPTALKDIEGWTQDDYRVLWGRVIESYASTVVFLDGWQYSNGCAYEFWVANKTVPRPSIVDDQLAPLVLEEGISLINSAVSELEKSGSPIDFLRRVSDELTKLEGVRVLAEV